MLETKVQLKRWESPRLEAPPVIPRFAGSAATVRMEPTLWDYWGTIIRHRAIILITVLTGVVLAALVSFHMTKLYSATGRITINRENSDVLGFKDSAANTLEDYDYNVALDTQVQVLQSDTLATDVIRKLRLDTNSRFAGIGAAAENSSVPNGALPTTGPRNLRALIDVFHNWLKIEKVPKTRVIEIRCTSPDPNLSAEIVNTLVASFIEHNFETKFQATMQTSDWLSKQLSDLQMKVASSQENLVKYETENNILGLDEKQNITTSKLNELNQQVTLAESDRIQKEAAYRQTQTGGVESIPAMASSEIILQLKKQQAELKNQYALLNSQYGPLHPKVVAVHNQLEEAEGTIQSEGNKLVSRIHNDYLASVQRENLLRAALEQQKQEANKLNESAIQYEVLKREADSNRQLYDGLLQKMKEASVSAGLRSGNIQVVDQAVPPDKPSKPNIPVNMAAAFFGSLMLGTIAAFVIERMNNSITSPEIIDAVSGWPSLGIIPSTRESSKVARKGGDLMLPSKEGKGEIPLVVVSRPRSKVAESFRAVRTSILLSSIDSPPKTMLVTSALPEEGKTTISANLAGALAQMGRRVLLVDGDMRRPRISDLLGLPANAGGLSTVLIGKDKEEDVIVPSAKVPNLYIMPAGPKPPYPAELLGSNRMKALIKSWLPSYDHIIIDTPPVLSVTDPVLLSVDVDAVVLVVRFGQTTKQALKEVREILDQVNARVCGVILNSVEVDHDSTYGRSYYAGYGYYDRARSYYEEVPEKQAT
ncbi:MAG: polysaccharide biosynthesis tyrosine autokinase [Candidatus Korobacteraceae bacterium]